MASNLTVREIADRTGAAIATVSRWCRIGKFPNARKVTTPIGEYWEVPETDLKDIQVKMGRPKKDL